MEQKQRIVSFDLETHLIKPGMLAPKMVCGSFFDGAAQTVLLREEALDLLADEMAAGSVIIGANIAYDFCVVAAERPSFLKEIFKAYDEGRVADVQLVTALHAVAKGNLGLHPDTGERLADARGRITNRYSLYNCVKIWLGRTDAKENDEWRLRYAELDGIPMEQWPEVAVQYCHDDAKNTYDVFVAQSEARNCGEIQGKTWQHITHQCRAAFVMQLASVWGIRTDGPYVDALEQKLLAFRAGEQGVFQKEGFLRLDGSEDTKAVKDYVAAVFSKLGVASPKTPKGAISTARPVLKESGDPLLLRYAKLGETDKALDTYIPFLKAGAKAPINVRANVLLDTGRTSYEGLIQTLPRNGGIREAIIPTAGMYFCSVDYAALELSTLAQCCIWTTGYSDMGSAINSGKDLHSMLAASIVNEQYESFILKVKAKEKKAVSYRQLAKAGNFGFGGMMGPPKFVLTQKNAGLSLCTLAGGHPKCGEQMTTRYSNRDIEPTCKSCLTVAVTLRENWMKQWSEMPAYFRWVCQHEGMNSQSGTMNSPGTGYIRGGLTASSGANHPFQHLASMGAKHALYNFSRESYIDDSSPLFGSRAVMFTHDEIVAELPKEKASKAAARQSEIMIDSMKEFVPDVKISAEPALMERLYKEAATKYNEKGELIPWTP